MMIDGAVRRKDRRIWYVVLGVFVMVFLFTFLTGRFKSDEEVGAANASKFDAGYIISDYQMSNYNSMSEAEIQAFLTKKNPCGNTNYGDYAFLSERYPNMKWHFENGHFVCLSEERFGEGVQVGEGETAAHIIYQAAQDYRINPQVLIVLLEKEQGLITDTFPNSVQYRSATGYGCPDTAACDTEYYGFRNQVRHAAALFRTVLDGGWTNYPLGNNYIQYNPNAACGGSVVNIRNLATSALYRYTPYQPNAGALAAGYGQAYCGAYGNRNFYLYFEEWFGGITSDVKNYSGIEDGEYDILLRSNNDLRLSVDEKDNSIILGDDNKSWTINKTAGGYYSILDENGLFLTLPDSSSRTLVLSEEAEGCSQRWILNGSSADNFVVYSMCSFDVLDVKSGVLKKGTSVWTYGYNGTISQRWTLRLHAQGDENGGSNNGGIEVPKDDDSEDGKNDEKEKILEEGEYIIHSALDSKFVIDINGGAFATTKNGTNIQLWTGNKTVAQVWEAKQNEDGTYTFVNPTTKKVLDVDNAGKTNGSNVQLYESNSTCAQKWDVSKGTRGLIIASACSGLALDADGSRAYDGTNLHLYKKWGDENLAQQWVFKKLGEEDEEVEGVYYIVSAMNKNMALDVANGAVTSGANVQLYQRNNTAAQVWQVISAGDYYSVVNPKSGKALDVQDGVLKSYGNMWIYEKNGSCAQRWKFNKQTDGSFVIVNGCAEKQALDVSNALAVNEANIQIYMRWGDNNLAQKWYLVRAD